MSEVDENEKSKSKAELDREAWVAFWKVQEIESKGNPYKRFQYLGRRCFDAPVTWIREKIIDPLHEKNKWAFYHRRFNRVPPIDQCKVGDYSCVHEANWQYRLDKMVDAQILSILRERKDNCSSKYAADQVWKCAKCIDDFEEAELNYYIKYGEMGWYADSVTAYMKQKHRMIWERRNPEVMEARQKAYEEHKANTAKGIYDAWFWKRHLMTNFKPYMPSVFKHTNQSRFGKLRDNPSLDPLYYKEKEETGKKEPSEGHAPWDTFP